MAFAPLPASQAVAVLTAPVSHSTTQAVSEPMPASSVNYDVVSVCCSWILA